MADKKPKRHLKLAVLATASGLFGASMATIISADEPVETSGENAISAGSLVTQPNSPSGAVNASSPLPLGESTVSGRQVIVVPFPDARSRAS